MDLRYRTVSVRMINDQKWRTQLSDDGRLVLYFLLTHPSTNRLGVYLGDTFTLAAEWPGRWPSDRMADALDELQRADMVRLDLVARVVWLRNFMRYHAPPNPNVVRGFVRDASVIPECDLRQHVLASVAQITADLGEAYSTAFRQAFPNHSRTIPKPLPKPFGNQPRNRDQVTDQDQLNREQGTGTDTACVRENGSETVTQTVETSQPRKDAVNDEPPTEADNATRPTPNATTDERNNDTPTLPPTPRDGSTYGAWPARRRRLGMAYEAERACMSVPHHLHEELLSRMAKPDEAVLRAWYGEIGRKYAHVDVGDDVHDLYRREFKEWKGAGPEAVDPVERAKGIAARINARRALRGVK
jgi:hypothetical protein